MSNGFLDLGELNNVKASGNTGCLACKMNYDCDTPDISEIVLTASGERKVLFIIDNPSATDDENGKLLSGESGKYLKQLLKKHIPENYAVTVISALKCAGKYKDENIQHCNIKLKEFIQKYKPDLIISSGTASAKSLLYSKISGRLSGLSYDSFFGEVIPFGNYNVSFTWDYRFVFQQLKKDCNYEKMLIQSISSGINLIDKSAKIENHTDKVQIITKTSDIIQAVKKKMKSDICAFDYETTGIKPHGKNHEIKIMSIADKNNSIVFPIFPEVIPTIQEFLKSDVKKIAHNLSFEDVWSYFKFNTSVENWYWDTMLSAHCLHNQKPTGLKYLIFCKLGIVYDDKVGEFLKSSKEGEENNGANAENRIMQAPLNDILFYCGLDSYYTYLLYESQKNQFDNLPEKLRAGRDFYFQSAVSLSHVNRNGIKIDIEKMESTKKDLSEKINNLYDIIMASKEVAKWRGKDKFNPTSNTQLDKLLYGLLKYSRPQGIPATDETALQLLNNKFCDDILKYRKAKKLRDTYIAQFDREICEGYIYPFFNLNRVATFRSCVAKGTKILVPEKYTICPDGVNIEDIKKGDYVYCFDDNLKLTLKKVLWAGKTGHRKVIRVHFNKGRGKKGYIDVTPEHKLRMVDGNYIPAIEVLNYDARIHSIKKNGYQPKHRVLSCSRFKDKLLATNNPEYLEHHFVYEFFSNDKITDNFIIHHKDRNHFNHEFNNLEKMTINDHSFYHAKDTLLTEKSRKRNIEVVKNNHKLGKYTYLRGKDNPNYIDLSKDQCLELLHKYGGCLKKIPYDFGLFKNRCANHNIDIKQIKTLYNKFGLYLSKDMVYKNLEKFGFSETCKKLQIGYYRLENLCKYYNIGYDRAFGNQTGSCKKASLTLNNHVITRIEEINTYVDVYDLEVEDVHNFIAGGICVHNSSSSPNFQNIPKRDKEAFNMIRDLIIPRTGHKLIEYDYKALEVSIAGCVFKDPAWLKYCRDFSKDMHRDVAQEILFFDKKAWEELPDNLKKACRQASKNGYVFPSVYGSTGHSASEGMWKQLPAEIKTHLKKHGIKNLSDFTKRMIEYDTEYWEKRYPIYGKKRRLFQKKYFKVGYIDQVSGFRCQAPLRYTQVVNYPVQGSASHIKLRAVCTIQNYLEKNNMNTKLVGEIHDALVFDCDPAEEKKLDKIVQYYGTKEVCNYFDWIIVPLVLDKESGGVDESWANCK